MLLHRSLLSPDLILDPLRRSLPITAQVLRCRAVGDRSQHLGDLRRAMYRVSSFYATIAMYQSRYFTEKRWWMPT